MGLATDSLDNFKKAIDEGNTAPLADMLADNVIFENTECEQEDKATVLAWAGAGGFTVGDWVVYHEDESTLQSLRLRNVCFGKSIHTCLNEQAHNCIHTELYFICALL
jgi:hypothetical protein